MGEIMDHFFSSIFFIFLFLYIFSIFKNNDSKKFTMINKRKKKNN